MKVRGLLFGGLSTLALVLTACPSPAIGLGIGSVTFTTASVAKQALTVGDTFTYQATANRTAGNTTAAQTVTYTSSNASVLTVGSTTGVASAITAGTATITAKSTVDTSKTAVLTVTVSALVSTAGVVSRVDAGSSTPVTATEAGGMVWAADSAVAGSAFTCVNSATSAAATPPNGVIDDPVNGNGTGGRGTFTVSTAGVANAAPVDVYASNHYCTNGNPNGDQLVYTKTVIAGGNYTLRLHFAETYQTMAAKRVFAIQVNGADAIPTAAGGATKPTTNQVDVFALTGARDKALTLDYSVPSVAAGAALKVTFTAVASGTGLAAYNGGDPFVSGVELIKL